MNKVIIEGQTCKKSFLLKVVDYNESYGRHIIKDFSKSLTNEMNSKIICDLGVGQGNDLTIIKDFFPNSEFYGVDFWDKNIQILNSKGIVLKVVNIEKDELPFNDNSIDLIVINQVLEHTKEIFWIFHQISKKLKIGGHVIIGVPNIASFPNRMLFLFGKQPSSMHSYSAHVRGFTHNEIPKFINVCFPEGYRIKKQGGAQFYPFPKVISRILSKLFPSLSHCSFTLIEKAKEYNDEFITHPIEAMLETNFYLGK